MEPAPPTNPATPTNKTKHAVPVTILAVLEAGVAYGLWMLADFFWSVGRPGVASCLIFLAVITMLAFVTNAVLNYWPRPKLIVSLSILTSLALAAIMLRASLENDKKVGADVRPLTEGSPVTLAQSAVNSPNAVQ